MNSQYAQPARAAVFLIASVIGAMSNSAIADDQPDQETDPTDTEWTASAAVEFVQTYCVDCHQGDDAESGLDLVTFDSKAKVVDSIETWQRIADRVHDGQMPPEQSETPTSEARKSFVDWIRSTIYQAVCDDGVLPGPPVVRRLNRTEYANTVRDLLGIHVNAGHALPFDGAGGEGFDNAAETLFISPIYAEKFLDAARSALGHALKDPAARKRIVISEPNADRPPSQAAREVMAGFLPRAFRRPASDVEIDQYVNLFDVAYEQDDSFTSAIQFALEAAMVSPKFLFRLEQPSESETEVLVSHHEMASRLSYFLWASMPDAELLRLADQGKLHDEMVLAQQVRRMLRSDVDKRGFRRDAKVRGFASSFVEQWLGTRALGREFKPDKIFASSYNSELEGGMKYEPILFFEDLLADNRSLLNLIDSDFTYVNRSLARHYRVKGEFRAQPKKVELSEDSHRGGLLGMSAVLAVSSFPHRTSPVLRGKWILETLLGTPPPPPPPNVPGLEEIADDAKPTSLRARLELHRTDPTCASCHATMDPLGFGLENFDVLGRWRTVDEGVPIDASGELPGGVTFNGPDELKLLLMERKEQFIRNLTSKMLGFALSRGLTYEDDCVVESILRELEKNDYKAQTLITEIVMSIPFRYKR